jgi:hypothetical protein
MKSILTVILIFTVFTSLSQKNSLYLTSNFKDASLGLGFKLSKKNINFYCETKMGGLFPAQDRIIDEWECEQVLSETQIYEYGITSWGSYVSNNTTVTERIGNVYSNYVINFGVSKNVLTINNCNIELGVGLGTGIKVKHEVHEFQYTNSQVYNLVLADYYDRNYDYNYQYKVFSTTKQVYNFNTSLVFSWNKVSTGISYDSNFSGVSFSFGVNF